MYKYHGLPEIGKSRLSRLVVMAVRGRPGTNPLPTSFRMALTTADSNPRKVFVFVEKPGNSLQIFPGIFPLQTAASVGNRRVFDDFVAQWVQSLRDSVYLNVLLEGLSPSPTLNFVHYTSYYTSSRHYSTSSLLLF